MEKLPTRSSQHETGDRADREFEQKCPDNWALEPIIRDYGRDYIVSIFRNKSIKEEFNVQLKGSRNPTYSSGNDYISFSLEVTTAKYLLNFEEPSMLAICDVSKDGKPVYWVWLNEDIKRIEELNPQWQQQISIAFRIPISRVLDETSHKEIEEYVHKYLSIKKLDYAAGSVLRSAFNKDSERLIEQYADSPGEYIENEVIKPLSNTGMFSVTTTKSGPEIEAYNETEKKLIKKLDQISTYLNSTQDHLAKELLEEIESEISLTSHKEIKARYLNSTGVLAIFNEETLEALEYYKKANALVPTEPKYITNLLYAEFEIAKNKKNGKLELPSDWEERLGKVLEHQPDFINSIRIKAQFLSETQGPNEAEAFLRSSEHWDKEQLGFLSLLSELYYSVGDIDRALSLFREAEPLMNDSPWYLWTQYGSKCLIKALDNDEFTFRGFGPANLDLELLNKAYDCYSKAIKSITSIGYPTQSAPAIVNYSVVCMLLGKPEESDALCINYLQIHPNHFDVGGALAASLFRQGKADKAFPYVKSIYDSNPNGKAEYRNYALVLLACEDYESLIRLIQERESCGFVDKEEEGLSRELASVSLFELGSYEESSRQIEIMRNDSSLAKQAFITEASIAHKNRKPKEEILSIYRRALKTFPDDEEILTKFIIELGTDANSYAKEIKESIETITAVRQLMPEEFYLLGNAYMNLDLTDEAVDIFTKAEIRFPSDYRFICEKANAYMKKGDDETAFKLLQEYTAKAGKSFEVLRSTAALAVNTGRIDDAIRLFHSALSKSQDSTEKGLLHCQLWHLKLRRQDPPKDIMRHAVEFGKTIKDDSEAEASYLMMFMFSPHLDSDTDDEIKSWVEEFRERLEKFKIQFPESKIFRAITIPEGLEGEDFLNELLAEMFKLVVEDVLGAVPFQFTSRSMPWFITMRAKLLRESDSVFMFWNICINSNDYSHAIHIWDGATDLDEENVFALEAKEVCIDLTALLTLYELELLSLFPDEFKQIYVPYHTKIVIDKSLYAPYGVHPIAKKLEDWRIENRGKIRVLRTHNDTYINDNFELSQGKLWVKTNTGIPEIFEDDPDYQAMRLSKNLGATLYSDEYLSRYWSIKENKIRAFSTLSFIHRLKVKKIISKNQEAELLSQMIQRNFRFVQFNSTHLFERLQYILSIKGVTHLSDDLKGDATFNAFFKQFGDAELKSKSLIHMATDLWVMILKNERIARDFERKSIYEIVINCMYLPTFSYSFNKEDSEERIAQIWMIFMWRSYQERTDFFQRAWSCVKSCCERMFNNDQDKCERILFKKIPFMLTGLISKNISDPTSQVTTHVNITNMFDFQDKNKIETYYAENPPSYFKA